MDLNIYLYKEELKMEIKVVGPGCKKCQVLYHQVLRAEEDLKRNDKVTKVEKYEDMMAYNILSTPALVINEKVMCSGRIASTDEIKKWILERE
jgi:small redox-active disulfide protein 2